MTYGHTISITNPLLPLVSLLSYNADNSIILFPTNLASTMKYGSVAEIAPLQTPAI